MKHFWGDDRPDAPARDDRDGAAPPRRLADLRMPRPGSAEELVAQLLYAAKPYQLSVGRRQRLGVGLARAVGRRRVPTFARVGLALGIVVCAVAAVSARLLAWPPWLAARLGPPKPAAAVARSATALRPRPTTPPERAAETAQGVETPPAVPVASLAPAPAPLHRRRPSAARRRSLEASAPAPSVTAAPAVPAAAVTAAPAVTDSEEDAALALAALSALRRAHDPVRARAMLDNYLRAHPDGPIAEEALAISLEAALAHHDHRDAAALATRYLQLYPSGSFRALARQALRAGGATR